MKYCFIFPFVELCAFRHEIRENQHVVRLKSSREWDQPVNAEC